MLKYLEELDGFFFIKNAGLIQTLKGVPKFTTILTLKGVTVKVL